MARKQTQEKPIPKDDPSRILPMTMEDVMHSSMMPYAEHVILERALPRVEDGLKPVQRRILYTMLELGNTPDKPHRKCARIVGDCLGKYHPHGDSSVYDALVRMAQDFSMRAPLVDGHGNFGSIDGDSAAAMRYTEARMTSLALLMLQDIEKDTVPFRLNFDDSLKEPDMLPARFPNLLVNGASGIAVGLATNIPPHNLAESIRAVIAQIRNPDITLDELMQYLPGPDFPTGGILVDNPEIRLGYETGRSKLSLRARVHTEPGASGRTLLVITEVPYQVNKAQMLEKILHLTEEKKQALSGIYDIRDESDRMGMRAVIELRKDADPEKILAYLYKYSDLQVTFGVNMVAIADGKPVQMGLKSMIHYFIEHQKHVVTRRTEYDLKQARARAHILEGLMIAVDNLDEVIRLIRASKTPKEARAALMQAFSLDEIQAQAILDMRLQRLTNLEILALRKEYKEVKALIARLENILSHESVLMDVIASELQAICDQYPEGRRTTIEKSEEVQIDPEENKKAPEDIVIAFTRSGQLKRMAPQMVKKTPLPLPQEDLKESCSFFFETRTDTSVYIFTNLGNVYQIKSEQLQECRPKDRGQQLEGLLKDYAEGEKPLFMFCAKPGTLEQRPDFLFVTRQGKIKRSPAADYDIHSRMFAALSLADGDEVVQILETVPDQDILLFTEKGQSIRFALDDIPQQGRISRGVNAIRLEQGDAVLTAFQASDKSQFLFFSDRGYGMRCAQVSFERQSRAGKGNRAFDFTKKGTHGQALASVLMIQETEGFDVLMIQARSAPTRLPVSSIAVRDRAGRAACYAMSVLDDLVTQVLVIPSDAVPAE